MQHRTGRLYQRKRGGAWWADYEDEHGARVRCSTGSRDKGVAAEQLRQWEADVVAARVDPHHKAKRTSTLRDALELLIVQREQDARTGRKSEATVKFYRQKAGNLLAFFGEHYPLTKLSASEVDRFVDARLAANPETGKPWVSTHTVHKELVTLRIGLKLARRKGIWAGDPGAVLPIGFSTGYKARERWLQDEGEAWVLIRELAAESGPGRASVVAYALALGAERSALLRARRSEMRPDAVHVHGSKHATRDRKVFVVAPWQRKLLDFVKLHADGEGDMLFRSWPNARRAMLGACVRAKIPAVTWNDLRRTYGTWMARDGVRSDLIAPQMGHTTSRMVETVYRKLGGIEAGEQMAEIISLSEARRIRKTGQGPAPARSGGGEGSS